MQPVRKWWRERQPKRRLEEGKRSYWDGRFKEALPILADAARLACAVEAWAIAAEALEMQGDICRTTAHKEEEETCFREALAYWEKAGDFSHAAAVRSKLGSQPMLGTIHLKDDPIFQQAPAIHSPTTEGAHGFAAIGLSRGVRAETMRLDEQVTALLQQGQYAQATALATQISELPPQDIPQEMKEKVQYFAVRINDVAGRYQEMGNYAKAESLYRQARELLSWVLGEGHPQLCMILNNLAGLHRKMGDYAKAEALWCQAREIWCQVLGGEEEPEFATILNNLAGLYQAKGEYSAAEPLYYQALKIRARVLGKDHPDVAQILDNLAVLCGAKGEYSAAKSLLHQALEIHRRVLGENHPDFAVNLQNLAALHMAKGKYDAAEPLLHQALEIHRQVRDENHPEFAAPLYVLAALCAATARGTEALTLMERAISIDNHMIGQIFSIASDIQRMAYLTTISGPLHVFLSLVSQHLAASPHAVHAALNLLLRRKALGAEALAAQRDAVLGGQYPALEPQVRELTTLRMQVAQKTLSGPGPEGFTTHRQQLAEWNAQKERLEAELARQIPEMNLERTLRAADRQAVARALSPGITLVEVVRFTVFDFHAIPARGERRWQEARYLAFVVAAGAPDDVQMVDLGEAEPIDRLIGAFRTALIAEGLRKKDRDSSSPEQRPGNGALAPPQSLHYGRQLRAQVFDPVVNALGGATRLFLSPDGDLTRLPFEILPQDDGHLLMDEGYRITYLSSGRDVLRFGTASSGEPRAPVVVANPNFDLGATVAVAPVSQRSSSEPITLTKGPRRSQDLERSSLHFSPLPGSQIEGERIAAKLNVQPWLVDDALEARLKACQSPRILHLSTHGFFLEDQNYDRNKFFQHHGMLRAETESGGKLLALPGMENPMLRSGLALAGANTGLRKEPLPPEAEDGLLTAEDVSGLNLLNTDLVVLSACETGLGERRTGEGVMGLRRAFVIAGAKTLVMSLWKVSDLSTAILMERFYLHLLDYHLPRDQALHQAQIDTRDITIQQLQQAGWLSSETIERFVAGNTNPEEQEKMRQWLKDLAQQPADHQPFTLPYYWGAFICQGDPSPLAH